MEKCVLPPRSAPQKLVAFSRRESDHRRMYSADLKRGSEASREDAPLALRLDKQ